MPFRREPIAAADVARMLEVPGQQQNTIELPITSSIIFYSISLPLFIKRAVLFDLYMSLWVHDVMLTGICGDVFLCIFRCGAGGGRGPRRVGGPPQRADPGESPPPPHTPTSPLPSSS